VVLAFLVYVIGLSLDKTCAVLACFCVGSGQEVGQNDGQDKSGSWLPSERFLPVAAGQVASNEGCSLGTFASAGQRVFLFGGHQDAATLDAMLPPEVFGGQGVSDEAAAYQHRFDQAQKCWAHLLRQAIRLALLYPQRQKYQRFLDELLAWYRDGQRAAADGCLGAAGRQERVTDLENRLCDLCLPLLGATAAALSPPERDFRNLLNELTERMGDGELFTFVFHPEVEPTNNFTER
jgi:transposase